MMVDSPERSPAKPSSGALDPSHLAFPVVGIGASAGGLQAVKRFFDNMPNDNGMAFVVIFHLSPDHQSSAGKLIEQVTKMPVVQVQSAVPIQKNHIYVISPAQHLSMNDGYLRVVPQEPRRGGPVTIDLFFRDLADVHQERAFCLVLSGTGSDGAVGLSRIKEQGGITLAQLPSDAEFDGMPQAAIDTGMVDFVLPVVEMPQKILELWHNSQHIQLPNDGDPTLRTIPPSNERAAALAEQLLHDILTKLRAGTGHDFRHYKRATVLRRIERRMQVTARADLSAYYEYLSNNPQETKALLDDMLIGVTNFFRDRESFESLEREVIPLLFSPTGQQRADNHEVRVWSAGASTGEEAYSLAMLLHDYKAAANSELKIQIFASDIDERAIGTGRAGLYPEAIITDVPPTRLRQYFVKEDNRYRVRKELRENVLFAKHSLLSDPPFSQMDLIVCRNLLIYLDREVQREILQMFHFALNPGGYLFLGNSESADLCHELFNPVDKKNRIFRAKTGSITSHRMPTMPRDGYSRAVSAPRPPLTQPAKKPSTAEMHQRALERFSPPSIIVSSDADILHISEGAGRYLHHMAGEVTRNLLSLISPDLRLELRTAMFQAQQTHVSVKARPVSLTRDDRHFQVAVTAHPFTDAQTETECVLIVFAEEEIDAENVSANQAMQSENQMLSNLERELQRTKLQLQDTIEQSEISGEELKASNEEMQAINEELRSATEELETSKEELQSINEELLTVNHELKVKVEETDQINDYLSNLISSTDIATVFVDRSLRIKWFTPRATDIFSMLSVDTGRPLMDITHRLDYDQMVDDALRVFETLSVIEREVPSDDNHWYIARLLPYRSSSDQIDGIVLTFIDISKRREAEEDLRLGEERMRLVAESTRDFSEQELKNLKESQNSSHLKDEFFAVMSHELKHPLNLIQLNAQVLRRLPGIKNIPAALKAASVIGEAVNSQARIIDDLMDVARVRTGKLQLERKVVDFSALLSEIEHVVHNSEHRCEITFDIPAQNDSQLFIHADPTRVEQIVWNLINNAIKFTPAEGSIHVVASSIDGYARLEVRDTGPGIAADQLDQIFEMFTQADHRAIGRHHGGLGVGLSLVKQLVESHEGHISAYSPGVGKGSTFTVELPLCGVPASHNVADEQDDEGKLRGLRILLVDDAVDVLETMAMLLEMESAEVASFSVPMQALERARQDTFDVVISDISMPGMDGYEFVRELRQIVAFAETPCIALTGYGANRPDKDSGGFDEHLGKPVAYDEFVGLVARLAKRPVS
jgi:two-component system CheB/CheR fusion protein